MLEEIAIEQSAAAVRGEGPRLSDYLRYLKPRRLAKMLYGIATSLLIGELMIALLNPQSEILPKELVVKDSALGFRMVPNYRGVDPMNGVPLEINSSGLRERELEAAHPGILRILVYGDSVAFGLRVRAEDAFPRALERVLQAQLQQPVQVINAGVPGYGTLQELKLFEENVAALQPDAVLVTVSVFNDVEDNVKFVRPQKRWENAPNAIYKPLRWLRQRSQLYMMMRQYRAAVGAETMMDIHAVQPSATTTRGLQLTEESLLSFATAARQRDVAFGILLAPAQKQTSLQVWNETLRSHGLEAAAYSDEQPNRRFADFAHQHGLPLLDLLPLFRQGEAHLYENEHWTPVGHSRVADAVAAFLRSSAIIGGSQKTAHEG